LLAELWLPELLPDAGAELLAAPSAVLLLTDAWDAGCVACGGHGLLLPHGLGCPEDGLSFDHRA
jgi:hypothetical protein